MVAAAAQQDLHGPNFSVCGPHVHALGCSAPNKSRSCSEAALPTRPTYQHAPTKQWLPCCVHRPISASTAQPPWLLERRPAGPNSEPVLQQKGTPEGGLAAAGGPAAAVTAPSAYFVFVRHGGTITAYPVDSIFSFRPPPRWGLGRGHSSWMSGPWEGARRSGLGGAERGCPVPSLHVLPMHTPIDYLNCYSVQAGRA